jgi:hypothetical protein
MARVTLTRDLPEELRIAHPICVAKKVRQKGYDPKTAPREVRMEAARECIQEGKLHGIAKLFRR